MTTSHPTPPTDDSSFTHLAALVGAADFTLDPAATAVVGIGATPGRDYLAPFLTPAELDAAVQRGA